MIRKSERERERSRRHCGHRVMLRVQRARRAYRELSAEGAAAQLLAIFAALVGSMQLATSPSPSRGYVPPPPRGTGYRPPPSVSEAMRIIRGARVLTPRVRAALDALKAAAPSASVFIEYKADWLEWGDIARCFVPGNDDATAARVERSAAAWQAEREPPKPKKEKKPKKDPKVEKTTFEP